MAGVSDFYVPNSGEVLLGEYKLYGNYGLANQFELGFINESFKLTINREVRPLKVNGAYCNTLDANGVPLVRIDRVIPTLTVNALALRYLNNNIISGAESSDAWESQDWDLTGGAYASESTIVQTGSSSAKMTASTTLHGIHQVFSTVKNLTAFENGETATTSDYITFSIYIDTQNKTDLGTSDLRLSFHMDDEGTETNLYYYDVTNASLTANQWNNFKVLKSAFTQGGTGNWATVKGVSLKLDGAPSAEVVCYIDSINHMQADVSRSFPISTGQGGKYRYTDEGAYKKAVPYLPIPDSNYLDNIGIVGQFHDGKRLDIILENVYDDGNVNLAIAEKTEVIYAVQFTAHYNRATPTKIPVEFRHYKT
jgi:hypothetical protein